MSSSVSYITTGKKTSETTAKSVNSSLSFELADIKTLDLGTGGKPVVGNKKSINYGTIGPITDTIIFDDGTKDGKNTLISDVVNHMNKTLFIPKSDTNVNDNFKETVTYYNRFKVANPNLALQKGFAHVFFVRPSCNILESAYAKELRPELQSYESFQYTWKHFPEIVKELVELNGSGHDFMLTLSNAVASFSLNEEYINSDIYGKTYTGYKIAYGKHNIDSKTAGEFQVTFNDDRNLHIYQLIKLWADYISGAFRGTISPVTANIVNKILDYVGACYYILTAEDGETILFWSKYYGVFPTNVPTSQYSWGSGNVITNPQMDVTFKYSFKEDFNPQTILEFNYNSKIGQNGAEYIPVYDPKLNHVGATWVGAPFIELHEPTSPTDTYGYKLRFRHAK